MKIIIKKILSISIYMIELVVLLETYHNNDLSKKNKRRKTPFVH